MNELIYNRASSNTYYNYADLNRVGEWCNYLAGQYRLYGISVDVNAKTNFSVNTFPKQSELQDYLDNVHKLINAYYVFTTTPIPPLLISNLTYIGANNIEKSIKDMLTLLDYMIQSFNYCGVFICGE